MAHNHRIVSYQTAARTSIIQNQKQHKQENVTVSEFFIKFIHSAHKFESEILKFRPMYILTGTILIVAELRK